MDIIREEARDIPVITSADVCVIGGSCTGVFAAVRAARLGARVVLVEQQNCFGGAATAGLVNVWHALEDTGGTRPVIGGLTAEVLARLEKRGAAARDDHGRRAWRLNTEELKIELDELVREHAVVPFLNTLFTRPIGDREAIRAVIIEDRSGRRAIRAGQFIDATGDGSLARRAGVPFFTDGPFQPPTTGAWIAGFRTLEGCDWPALVRERGAEFCLEPDWGWGGPIPGLDDIQFRADTHVFGVDAADAGQLTAAEMEGRRKVRAMMDLLRRHGPATARLALVNLAAVLGVRETARARARGRVSGADILSGRRFASAVVNGTYPVDIHHGDGPGITFRYLDGTERVIAERGKPARHGRWRPPQETDPAFYQAPWECLVPERPGNLALAGRLLCADRIAFSALRVMVNLNQTGEAAGVACALAAEAGTGVGAVEAGQLRAALAAGGSVII